MISIQIDFATDGKVDKTYLEINQQHFKYTQTKN